MVKKPNEKIGGGAYFDGTYYYVNKPQEVWDDSSFRLVVQDVQTAVPKSEYEQAIKDQAAKSSEYEQATSAYNAAIALPWRQQAAAIAVVKSKYPGFVQTISTPSDFGFSSTSEQLASKESYAGTAPSTAASGMMPQSAIPEYELDQNISTDKERRSAKREGYEVRTVRKINALESKTNKGIGLLNQAKREHVDLVKGVNAKIGSPSNGGYGGWGANTINEAYQYAMDKAADGKKSAAGHAANAKAYADRVQAQAETDGTALQTKFDAAGGKLNQANHMQDVIGHLMTRQQDTASAQSQKEKFAQIDQPGLLTSAQSTSPFASNSISEMLKT